MVWFLVDDVLPFHERVLRAGNAAMGLWVRGGAWCSGQLTDGFIPADVARTMGTAAEIRRLVAVGLWAPGEHDGVTGYRFHAWAEDGTGQKRQPTKAEVEDKRRREREKKQRQRAAASRDDTGRYSPALSPGDTHGDNTGDTRGESLRTRPDQTIPPLLAPLEGGAPPVDKPGESNPHDPRPDLSSDPEPSPRCAAHADLARPPRCGACKDARLDHERWEIRTLAAEKATTARRPAWDPVTHCEHGQIRGACDACAYEASRAGTVIQGPWGEAPCEADAAGSRGQS